MSSSCIKKLEAEAQGRYRANTSFAFMSGPRNLLPVTAAYICGYLVEGVCIYTREQFKCYKIGDAYPMHLKFFKAVKRRHGSDGIVLVAATVDAS
ncbi:hypothetical protein MTO96_032797 [Rhipicephalus appendiculatus]